MHLGRRIDDRRKIVPVEAAKRQFIVKFREGDSRMLANRNRHASRYSVRKFGRCQNSAYRTITLKRPQKRSVLHEYKLAGASIVKEPERLKVSVAPDCYAGRVCHFA